LLIQFFEIALKLFFRSGLSPSSNIVEQLTDVYHKQISSFSFLFTVFEPAFVQFFVTGISSKIKEGLLSELSRFKFLV
jgi:hypothetical protein